MAGTYDHLVGELLVTGDKGWLSLTITGKPTGAPATKLPPAPGVDVWACPVVRTDGKSKDLLMTQTGAPVTDHNTAAIDKRYYPAGSPTDPRPVVPPPMNNPVLNAINPSTAKASAASFVMNVNGSSFYPESKLSFGGNFIPFTFVNSGQLTASINPANFAVGSFLVHVDNNGSLSINKTFTFSAG